MSHRDSCSNNSTPEDRVRLWLDLMQTCDELLCAGLRRQTASDEEFKAAYQAWYRRTMAEHDATIARMAERFGQGTLHAT